MYNYDGTLTETAYSYDGTLTETAYSYDGSETGVVGSPYVRGAYVPFAEMTMTDVDGVISTNQNIHKMNADKTLLMQGTASSVAHTVTFTGSFDMGSAENIVVWVWIDRNTKGNYNAVTVSKESQLTIKVGNATKEFSGKSNRATLKSGMTAYLITKNEIGSSTFNSIQITVNGAGTFYLDSIEYGFRMKKPRVLLNLDSSGKNFYPVGYPLFKKHGLVATFDYNIDRNNIAVGASSGTWADANDAKKHFEMVADGFDYATYSGWYEEEGTYPSTMDSEADREKWELHAQRMWHLNNVFGIYAPSCVNNNAFKSGELHQKIMCEAGFIMDRTDARMLTSTDSAMNAFSYFDGEDYREVTPYYLGNCYEAGDVQIANAITVLKYCIRYGQNCMIMMHTIKEKGYDYSNNTLDVGYDAIDELLTFIKSEVDKGTLLCQTSEQFVHDLCPDIWEVWNVERSKSASTV